eukprot:5373976-Prymnesium_polylepis.1
MLRPVAIQPTVSHQLNIAQDTIAKNQPAIDELQRQLKHEKQMMTVARRVEQELSIHNAHGEAAARAMEQKWWNCVSAANKSWDRQLKR